MTLDRRNLLIGSLALTAALPNPAPAATIVNNSGDTLTYTGNASAGADDITNNGWMQFSNNSTAGNAAINNSNGGSTRFNDSSTASGATINNSAGSTIFYGFSTADHATINNSNSATIFYDNSTASSATINNNSGAMYFSNNSTAGASTITNNNVSLTTFNDASTANHAIIINNGHSSTDFSGASTAGNATITNNSGWTNFYNSTADHATITNNSGWTYFTFNSTAGSATINNNSGSSTQFSNTSTAGNATINNNNSETRFHSSSTAGSATINNNSGSWTIFSDTSTAGTAAINNSNGGLTQFSFNSTAGGAIINNSNASTLFYGSSTAGSATINSNSGSTVFYGSSTAGNASITNNFGGWAVFFQNSTAGNAAISNSSGGSTQFHDSSTANFASITNNGGTTVFFDTSTAGNATITNNGGSLISFYIASTAGNATINNSGWTQFSSNSTAGSATINNSNTTLFYNTSTAGNATITNTISGSGTVFYGSSAADHAAITNNGGATGFADSSTADHAIITNQNGGTTSFFVLSTAGSARLINAGAGVFDFSGSAGPAGDHRLSAGSIEGGGGFLLGRNEFTVGANALSTAVDGVLADGGTFGGVGASLVKVGSGTLTLNGANTYTGPTSVNGGWLVVGDAAHPGASLLSAVTVNTGAGLGGIGTLGGLTANAGGTVAPGNSIGTLTVNGNVNFAAGSIYTVEANAAGQSDKIVASGTATLSGGTVQVQAGAGAYSPITTYTILSASGGVTGTFAGVTSNLAFLTPGLFYDPNHVFLRLARNDIDFSAIGATRNQRAIGAGIQALGLGNPVYDAILGSAAPGARQAFDRLSGEIHATLQGSLVETSRAVTQRTTDRLRRAGAPGRSPALALAYGEPPASGATLTDVGAPLAEADTGGRSGVWGEGFGNWGRANSDGNAADAHSRTAGFLLGADRPVGEAGRLGFMGGYSHTNLDTPDLGASGRVDSYHLGVYAGVQGEAFALRTALTAARHRLDTRRVAVFPGASETLQSDSWVSTAGASAELAYAAGGFEPYAQLAYVRWHGDSFAERGGNAALQSGGGDSNTTFATLGLRASTETTLAGEPLGLRGGLGWRQASGDRTPVSTLRFNGSQSFTAAGLPLPREAAVVEAGLGWVLGRNAHLGLSYDGAFGEHARDQALRVSFEQRF